MIISLKMSNRSVTDSSRLIILCDQMGAMCHYVVYISHQCCFD